MSNTAKTVVIVSILIVLAFGYMAWLDHGCASVGVMTWSGKVCAENLK